MSEMGQGGWHQKNGNFFWRLVLFMASPIYADLRVGEKKSNLCWRNIGMVPKVSDMIECFTERNQAAELKKSLNPT